MSSIEVVATGPPSRKRKAPSKRQCIDVWRRDRWLCRWCQKPVIFAPVMRLLEIEARAGGSETPLAYSHVNWARMFSPLLDELGATLDHVQAHSSGGPDTNDNFCTACTKCNYRKGKFELAEFLSRNPTKTISSKYGEPQNWDGLSAVFTALAIRHPLELTGADKQWLKVLATIP